MTSLIVSVLVYLPIIALIFGIVIFLRYATKGKWNEVSEIVDQHKAETIETTRPISKVADGEISTEVAPFDKSNVILLSSEESENSDSTSQHINKNPLTQTAIIGDAKAAYGGGENSLMPTLEQEAEYDDYADNYLNQGWDDTETQSDTN